MKDWLNQGITEINQNQEADLEQGQEIEKLKKGNRELKLYTLGLVRLRYAKGIISDAELWAWWPRKIIPDLENETGPSATHTSVSGMIEESIWISHGFVSICIHS